VIVLLALLPHLFGATREFHIRKFSLSAKISFFFFLKSALVPHQMPPIKAPLYLVPEQQQ
jgi:hypothetical protein